jgi:hypothetical protein
MSQAVLCPVCNGSGGIPKQSGTSSSSTADKPCHGCNGRGWVEVGISYPTIPPYNPYPAPYPRAPYSPWDTWIIVG